MWRDDVHVHAADDQVFVDENGLHLSMTPSCARRRRGLRAYGATPRNKGSNVSLIAVLTSAGRTAALTVSGSIDRSAFEVYIEQVLIPVLQAGQTVVMDNLSVHKSAKVEQLIEACGCVLRFLPAYSPDFSPVEGSFGKLKHLV